MLKHIASRLFVGVLGLAVGLGLCELALNFVVRQDEDGNRTYRGIHLKPFALPQRRLATLLKELRAAKTSAVVYSPALGWDARPSVTIARGETLVTPGFRAHRAPESYALTPSPDTLRILLFGDSFTACATADRKSVV